MGLKRQVLLYSGGAWGGRVLALLVAPLTIAYLSPEHYGVLAIMMSLRSIGSALARCGVGSGVGRFVTDSESDDEKRAWVRTAFGIWIVGLLSVLLLAALVGGPLCVLLGIPMTPGLFVLLLGSAIVGRSLMDLGKAVLSWTFRAKAHVRIELTESAVRSALVALGLVLLGIRAFGIVAIAAATSVAAGVWAVWRLRDMLVGREFDRERAGRLMRLSLPLLGVDLTATLARTLDRTLLAFMLSLAVAGKYSVAAAFAVIFEAFVGGFLKAWRPHVLDSWRQNHTPRRIAQVFGGFAFLAGAAVVVAGLWAAPAVGLIRPGNDYAGIGLLVPWLIAATAIYQLGDGFSPGIEISLRTRWRLVAFGTGAVVNLGLNLTMIPFLDALGACLATISAAIVTAAISIRASNRMYPIPLRWVPAFVSLVVLSASTALVDAHLGPVVDAASFALRATVTLALVAAAALPFVRELAWILLPNPQYD